MPQSPTLSLPLYLLSLVFLLLFQDVGQVDEFLHGLHLPAQVLQVHPTGPAVRLQQEAEPLAYRLTVHLRPAERSGVRALLSALRPTRALLSALRPTRALLRALRPTRALPSALRPTINFNSENVSVLSGRELKHNIALSLLPTTEASSICPSVAAVYKWAEQQHDRKCLYWTQLRFKHTTGSVSPEHTATLQTHNRKCLSWTQLRFKHTTGSVSPEHSYASNTQQEVSLLNTATLQTHNRKCLSWTQLRFKHTTGSVSPEHSYASNTQQEVSLLNTATLQTHNRKCLSWTQLRFKHTTGSVSPEHSYASNTQQEVSLLNTATLQTHNRKCLSWTQLRFKHTTGSVSPEHSYASNTQQEVSLLNTATLQTRLGSSLLNTDCCKHSNLLGILSLPWRVTQLRISGTAAVTGRCLDEHSHRGQIQYSHKQEMLSWTQLCYTITILNQDYTIPSQY